MKTTRFRAIDVRNIDRDQRMDYELTGRTSHDDDIMTIGVFAILFANQLADGVATDVAYKAKKWKWAGATPRDACLLIDASRKYNNSIVSTFNNTGGSLRWSEKLMRMADMIDRMDEIIAPSDRYNLYDQTRYAIRLGLSRAGIAHEQELAELYFSHGMAWCACHLCDEVIRSTRNLGKVQMRYIGWLRITKHLWMLKEMMRSTRFIHHNVCLSRSQDVRTGFRAIFSRMLSLQAMDSAISAGCCDSPTHSADGSVVNALGLDGKFR